MTTPSLGIRTFTPQQLLRMARLFADDPQVRRLLDPRARESVRYELACTPHVQVWLMTWPVGERAGWHDHGDSDGAFVVLEGEFTESTWTGGAVGSKVLRPGDHVEVARGRLHELRYDGDEVGLTVHAYAPELGEVTPYEWVSGRPVPVRP